VKSHKTTQNNHLQADISDENVEEQYLSQEELESIIAYNNNITTLDEDYARVQPMSKILVRSFLLEPNKSEHGLLEPHKQLISIPTNAGVGSLMEIESPFPYSDKAIIVAVPEGYTSIKPGDIVQLESNPIKPVTQGHGANATIFIPHSYMHPDAKSLEIPRNSSDKHYGYLLIPYHEISTKIA
jgi:hypothetical protein